MFSTAQDHRHQRAAWDRREERKSIALELIYLPFVFSINCAKSQGQSGAIPARTSHVVLRESSSVIPSCQCALTFKWFFGKKTMARTHRFKFETICQRVHHQPPSTVLKLSVVVGQPKNVALLPWQSTPCGTRNGTLLKFWTVGRTSEKKSTHHCHLFCEKKEETKMKKTFCRVGQ